MSGLEFPSTIRILGQEFTVRVVTRDEAISRDATRDTVGQTDLNLQRITVRGPEDLSPHQAAETLFHEAIHGVMYLFNLGEYLEDHHDEAFVRALAPALMHTLRDNPQLVATIMSDLSQPRAGEVHSHDGDGQD